MRGHWALLITRVHRGEFALAIEHYEKALSLYASERQIEEAFRYAPPESGVAIRCFGAWAFWYVGKIDRALDLAEEALTRARELSEPQTLAHALLFSTILHQLRREGQIAHDRGEEAIALCSEHGLAMYQAMVTSVWGWSLIDQGRQDEAIEQMRSGLAAHRATGAELLVPHFLVLLGEAVAGAGETEQGLGLLDEALAVATRGFEIHYLAELYRIRGEVLLRKPAERRVSRTATVGNAGTGPESRGLSQAEPCFKKSIKIAQQQGAISWELRSTMSLARLYRDQGKQKEGRDLLKRVYDKFTEGFDTMDLREARALLDE
jgi:predicted ATPase